MLKWDFHHIMVAVTVQTKVGATEHIICNCVNNLILAIYINDFPKDNFETFTSKK